MTSRESSLEEYRARIARALSYIQANLAEEVDLDSAAAVACFSKYHFHRIFTALVGESFADYLRRLRLERAAVLLETRPSMSVTDVALATGFSSPSVLSRDFSDRFGLPPSAWREKHGPGATAVETGLPWQGGSALDKILACGCESLSVKELGPFHFATVLSTGGYGPSIDAAWGRLCRWAGPRGLLGPTSLAAGMAWDSPEITEAARCRYSVCIAAPPQLKVFGEIIALDIPLRSYLVLAYKGPDLSSAYNCLYKTCLPSSGFEPEDAPSLEFYRSFAKPMKVFDLEIALPVKALGGR